eukprot:gene5857-4180_t
MRTILRSRGWATLLRATFTRRGGIDHHQLLSPSSLARTGGWCSSQYFVAARTSSSSSSSSTGGGIRVGDEAAVDPSDMSRVQEYSIHAKRALEAKEDAVVDPPPSAEALRDKIFSKCYQMNEEAKKELKDGELIKMWRELPNNPALTKKKEGETPPTAGAAEDMNADVRRKNPSLSPPSPQDFTEASAAAADNAPSFRDSRPADPNESVESMQKRLYYQSQYRGMVEMDLICGHFARTKVHALGRKQLMEYDYLLKQLDNDLFKWLVMEEPAPAEVTETEVFHLLKKFIAEERKELLGHY